MSIILTEPEKIKTISILDYCILDESDPDSDPDIDVTATELLGLGEFVVEWYDIDEAKQETIFYCRIRADYGLCPRCRSVSGDIHQYKRRRVRDMMCFGHTIYLLFDIRRFRCPECHKVFTESLDSITFNQQYTRRFEWMVYQECLSQTIQDVARKLEMNWHTVERIFHTKACEQLQYSEKQFPRILGVDEIANKKGHKQYLLVISDLQRKCVIEVLPNRLKETLVNWLYSLPVWVRENICVVSMDLWKPYKHAIQEVLPHAEIVADRYHVMKNLNKVLDKAQRAILRMLKRLPIEDITSTLKGFRWVLLKNEDDLDADEKKRLQSVYSLSPMLRQIHRLKERFRRIFEQITDRKQAERFLNAWICEVKQLGCDKLKPFIKTLEGWWEHILNYFNQGITNGAVEGINNRVKLIKRRAYGYRNVTNFRNRVVAEISGAGPLAVITH
jgi:transposase